MSTFCCFRPSASTDDMDAARFNKKSITKNNEMDLLRGQKMVGKEDYDFSVSSKDSITHFADLHPIVGTGCGRSEAEGL